MRAPGPFDRLAVNEFRPGPTFRAAQNDDGPGWERGGPLGASFLLNKANLVDDGIHRRRHLLVHRCRFVPFDKIWLVTVSSEEVRQLVIAEPSQHGGIRDLVAIQMKDVKHGPIASRI